jgi:thymidylate kinase
MGVQPQAVLVTGLYGSGKSSLVEELAGRLESLDLPYGAIDVDWLRWFHLPTDSANVDGELWRLNLRDVAGRYLDAGVHYLLLAQAARHNADVQAIGEVLPCPLRVIRLDVPLDVVEARLSATPTTGRADDLAAARRWVGSGWGTPDAELVLDGREPLAELASQVLDHCGWARRGGDLSDP